MTTLIEKSILNERLEKSRSGTYADTSENRRKHRVGQKYGSEKKEEEKPEKTDPNKMSPEQQLEAINKVIAAVNEGKLKLPPEEINTLVAKKTMAEEAVKQAKGEKKPEKKEEPKKGATKPEEKSEGKQYASMDIKEAKKELVGKKITIKKYFFDGIDSYKDAEGEIKKVRLYGKEKQPIAEIDFPNGDGIAISLEQLDKRKAMKYEIEFNDSKSEEPEKKEEPKNKEKSEQKPDKIKKPDPSKLTPEQLHKEINELRHILIGRIKDGRRTEDVEKRISDMLKYVPDKVLESTLEDLKTNVKPNPTAKIFAKIAAKLTEMEINRRKTEGSTKQTEKKEETPKEEPKSEPKQSEAEESYTRVKFDDVPNSGKVNLKKYLSDKVRNQADENLGVLSKVSFENLQTMEKGLVKEFNSQFGSLSKSRRAEKLYSIMKVKSELENRKQEESKKYQKYTSSLDDNTLLSIGYDLGEEIRKLSSRGFSTLEQQQEVLKKISELSVKRQINEDEQRKRMDKLNNSPDEITAK